MMTPDSKVPFAPEKQLSGSIASCSSARPAVVLHDLVKRVAGFHSLPDKEETQSCGGAD